MAIVVDDFKSESGLWIKGYRVGTPQYITKSGRRWDNMSMRCKTGGAAQADHTSYIGCTMSDNFKDFQYFANWYTSQVGYGEAKYHLDKDILFIGNREYSEGACVLVPSDLNLFLGSRKAARGEWPQGVSYHKAAKKFAASLNIDAETKYLGLFQTPITAARAYKAAKEAEAYRWYERLKAGEFIVDERVIERMRTWTHICDWAAP